MEKGFVFIDEIVDGIRWDAKYSTWDNFTGGPVAGYYANRIVGTIELANALLIARNTAAEQGYGLLLWDGYRPVQAVRCFLEWAKQPENNLTKERHYPNIEKSELISMGYVIEKSSHSRGSAIDLTLYQIDTNELVSMGGGFDLMDERSHHTSVAVTDENVKNRRILKSIMECSGFEAYEFEWWHYMLKDEPYPNIYFGFSVR